MEDIRCRPVLHTILKESSDLDDDGLKDLAVIKNHFKELADLRMMKESLRGIYRVAINHFEAELSLDEWCKQPMALNSEPLMKMVKCLRQHWKGILGFWKYDKLTNVWMDSTTRFKH